MPLLFTQHILAKTVTRGSNKMNEKKYQSLRKKSISKGGDGLYRHADTHALLFLITDGFRCTCGGCELETLDCA